MIRDPRPLPRQVRLRQAAPDDGSFVGEMLLVAATWWAGAGDETPSAEELLAIPQVADYVEGWGRPGDGGVIAEWEGKPVGACWFRRFTPAHPGYGFLGEDVPGIGLSVREEYRGRGIGTSLLAAALATLLRGGAATVSLSVELGNERARRLYERAGFEPVGREGGSITMRLDLADAG